MQLNGYSLTPASEAVNALRTLLPISAHMQHPTPR